MLLSREKCRNLLGAIFLIALIITMPGIVEAETTSEEFALFKRTISPAWQWGENGVLTIPKATSIGKYNFYAALLGQEAGEIQGEKLYNTNLTVVLGTSDDAEIGYSRRQLIWENLDRTDLDADVFYIKTRVLNLAESMIPQLSVGVIGTSLKDNQFTSTKEILFNPFAAATLSIPLFGEGSRLSVTGVAESLYTGGESTDFFYNAGADLSLFDNMLILAVEYQGIGSETTDAIMNAGVKLKLFDFLSIGAGKFNMSQSVADKSVSLENSYMMYFAAVDLAFGRWSEED